MNEEGAKEWERITGENIKKKCAIIFDGIVFSTPVIMSKIIGGKSWIQGMATTKEAKILSILLKSGALEIPLKIIE
jgi:preprotein translocase subunit SecD